MHTIMRPVLVAMMGVLAACDFSVNVLGDGGVQCTEGAHMCSAGQTSPLVCRGGTYVADGKCSGETVCDPREGLTRGTCQPRDPVCVGRAPGETFCDGAARTTCGFDLLDHVVARCDSAEHCKQGNGKLCAACLSGSAICDGSTLKTCAFDQSGYRVQWSCATEALCSASTASCIPPACAPGAHRCTGDVLEACKATLAGWDPIETCGAGLCNATAGACDECKVGAADCAGAVPRTCDATGHWKLLPACGGSTPVCSAGVCVASG